MGCTNTGCRQTPQGKVCQSLLRAHEQRCGCRRPPCVSFGWRRCEFWGREWKIGLEEWMTDLACRALDAIVKSSGDREKLKICKQGKCYDRASMWKINLLRGCRWNSVRRAGRKRGDVARENTRGLNWDGSYSDWKVRRDRRDQVPF